MLNKYGFIFIVFSVFGVMLILNFLTPLLADDYGMAAAAKDIGVFKASYQMYLNWNGRIVPGVLAYLFPAIPKLVFTLCNALMFTWLTLLIYFYANPASSDNRRYNIPLYLFILFLIGTQAPLFGQTFLWISGSVNYLWGTSIILTFVYIYYWNLVLGRSLFKQPVLGCFIMFPAGFIAGGCSENTSGGGILLIIFLLAYGLKWGTRPRSWHFSGPIGALAGFLFLVLSPGGLKRVEYFEKIPRSGHPLMQVLEKFNVCTIFLRDTVPTLLIIFVVLFIISAIMNKRQRQNYLAAMFFLAGLATVYAMVLAPAGTQSGRSMFGATILLISACAYSFSAIKTDNGWAKILLLSLVTLMGMHFFSQTIGGGIDIINLYSASKRRGNYVMCQRDAGVKDVVVASFSPKTKYSPLFGLSDITGDKNHWINSPYARKFGLNSIIAVDYAKWYADYRNINPHCGVLY